MLSCKYELVCSIVMGRWLEEKGLGKMVKLHLGCGSRVLKGWINIDINTISKRNRKLGRDEGVTTEIDVAADLSKCLPFQKNCVDIIYNEHFIEHFSYVDGLKMLRSWCHVLKPGGVLRMATPSIEDGISLYEDESRFNELNESMGRNIQSRCVFLNKLFRSYGHRFIYDEEMINRALLKSGYADVKMKQVSESEVPELKNIETRIYGESTFLQSMCVEAWKPKS